MPRKRGRPTSLTKERENLLFNALAAGASFETAAAFAGVARSTFQEWLKRGRRDEQPYAALLERVDEAVAISEVRDLQRVNLAAETTWQAAAWRLERRWPERYGRRTILSTPTGESVEIKFAFGVDDAGASAPAGS